MAVTKIKPIRGTVNKAIAYILDPQKTDDAFYVSSYGCAASDAAAKEFEWTRNLAVQQGMQMPKVLARHLIQSFDIGEVTPEEAHEVGKQLADEWLKGKYEYVIATHIDKGHCHNHIIFNAVNYVDFHAYRSNKRTYRELRQLSDEICKEHGLSVIPPFVKQELDKLALRDFQFLRRRSDIGAVIRIDEGVKVVRLRSCNIEFGFKCIGTVSFSKHSFRHHQGKCRVFLDAFQHGVCHVAAGLADHGNNIVEQPAFKFLSRRKLAADNETVHITFGYEKHLLLTAVCKDTLFQRTLGMTGNRFIRSGISQCSCNV